MTAHPGEASAHEPGDLARLFAPRSVAVVGASEDAAKVGGRVLKYLADGRYRGRVVAVNPRRTAVMGVPAVPAVAALDAPVDTAIIALPPDACIEAVAQCASAGVGAAVVLTSGFAEAGPEGARRQDALRQAIHGTATRLLGPNCLGVVNERIGYVGTFATMWAEPWLAPGAVAIVSQSGATASYLFVLLRERGIGISAWVATGNEADVDAADCIRHLVEDAATRVVVVALEGVGDGIALCSAVAAARDAGKAVLVLKVGRSHAGSEAVRSHTAALAGDDRVFDAAMRQCGAVRCDSYTDAVDVAAALATVGTVPGPRIGIVSASGGAGVLMADRGEQCGLDVPPLSPATRHVIDAAVPGASSRNPVDVTAMVLNDLGLLAKPVATLRASGEVDAVVAFLTSAFRSDEAVTRIIAALGGRGGDATLLLSAFTSSANLQRLFAAGLPTYVDPVRAIDVAAALHRVAVARATRSWRAPPGAADLALPATLDEAALLDFFARNGVPCIAAARVTTADDAVAAAVRLGFPVALKVSLQSLAHKADIGGVAVGLRDAESVRQAFSRIAGALRDRGESVAFAATVQPMARGHREMMFGFRRDPVFGPVVLLGFGGAWVEIIDDVVLRLAPVDTQEAHAMIDALRGRALLDGARGQPPADVAALASALATFSRIVCRLPGVASVELNPVIMGRPGEGAVAVDAKLARAR